jgi:hypothetical protein
VAKLEIATAVQLAHEAGGVEHAMERRIIHDPTTDPAQHFGWAVAVVIALHVGIMHLMVEIPNPLVVGRDQLSPTRRALKVPVRHPPNHIKVGLDIALPALAALDRLVLDS